MERCARGPSHQGNSFVVAPTFIRSAAEFHSVVLLEAADQSGTFEGLVFEFKGQVDGWNGMKIATEEQRKEVCRDIA